MIELEGKTLLIVVAGAMLAILGLISAATYMYNLNGIKSKTVGDGQHGAARFATPNELKKTYVEVPYEPELWRKLGKNCSKLKLPQGVIVGMKVRYGLRCDFKSGKRWPFSLKKKVIALVETGDVHGMMVGAAGCGKTAYWLYPNLEYACASGMSFLTTDTKSDLYRNYANICKLYGYEVAVIDLRNPTKSDSFNLLHLVNKYMDRYKESGLLSDKAKAEKFAKIIAKTLIYSDGDASAFGQNAFFYDAAEGLMTAVILLIAEFAEPEERHIVSVFKLIQDLQGPSGVKGKNQFQLLLELLGSGTNLLERAAALGAPLGHNLGESAVMAHQPVICAVIGQMDAATGTFRGFPAVHADQRPGITTAVQQQNGLLPRIVGIDDGIPEGLAEGKVISLLQFLPHIHNGHRRKLPPAKALFDFVEPVGSGFCPVHALHRWGG